MTAGPFLKWAGGKRSLLPKILPLVPREMNTYFEPFLGGGAVFFAVAASRKFLRAVLSDANLELVRTYRAVQADVDGVLRALDAHTRTEAHYLKVREQYPARLSDAGCAARMIFLNRAGYNGLFRLNRLGEFNVPFDRHSAGRPFARPEQLRVAAAVLNAGNVEVRHCGFRDSTEGSVPGDFLYLDPPYVPVSKMASFTSYTAGGFTPDAQVELSGEFRRLDRHGVAAVLSQSDCAISRFLYAGMAMRSVSARRPINRNGAKRGKVGELLVLTRAVAKLGKGAR